MLFGQSLGRNKMDENPVRSRGVGAICYVGGTQPRHLKSRDQGQSRKQLSSGSSLTPQKLYCVPCENSLEGTGRN